MVAVGVLVVVRAVVMVPLLSLRLTL